MDFVFHTFAAVFLLFSAASCAPLEQQDACANVRSSSLELNHIAKQVAVEARKGSTKKANFTTSLVWIVAEDMCDPGTLKHKSATCIGKLVNVLTSYKSEVKALAGFHNCSEFVSKVNPVLDRVHDDMNKCLESRGVMQPQMQSHISKPTIPPWQEPLLCYYTMDRLFSFSILTARVFAVGDPADHTEGSAKKCTKSI